MEVPSTITWFVQWTAELSDPEHEPVLAFLRTFLDKENWPDSVSQLKDDYTKFIADSKFEEKSPLASTMVFWMMRKRLILSNGHKIVWRNPHPLAKPQENSGSDNAAKWATLSQRFCNLCIMHFPTEEDLSHHTKSAHSTRNPKKSSRKYTCRICNLQFDQQSELETHENSSTHLSMLNVDKLNSDRMTLELNKGRIEVGMPELLQHTYPPVVLDLSKETIIDVPIRNNGRSARFLTSCRILPTGRQEIMIKWKEAATWTNEDLIEEGKRLKLDHEHGAVISVMIKPRFVGEIKAILLLNFQDFAIARYIEFTVEDDVVRSLAPTTPFQQPERFRGPGTPKRKQVIPGVKPFAGNNLQTLPQYGVPSGLREQVQLDSLEAPLGFLRMPITPETYRDYFMLLLHFEELQQEIDIEVYSMTDVALRESNKFYILQVPGLAERRPSIIKGDCVLVSFPGSPSVYEGCVHRIYDEEVYLKFHSSFSPAKTQLCNIQFRFNRILLRRAKHSVMLSSEFLSQNVVIPEILPFCLTNPHVSLPYLKTMKWALNEEQQEAAQQILLRHMLLKEIESAMDFPPYLIYGPPGTGKTTTLVECIWQVLRTFPEAKVLACAPSNSAADNIVKKMSTVLQQREMVRVMAATRQREVVEEAVFPFCRYNSQTECFDLPSVEELRKARVVVSTCFSSSLIAMIGVPRKHFTHIFVDEAGHAQEPEGLLPAASLLGRKATLVLVGDPNQLGPIVRSNVAKLHGLEVSFLQRLMGLPLYNSYSLEDGQYEGFNPALVTKLKKNYRSHPAILHVPSVLFYDGELEAYASVMHRESLCEWDGLTNKNQFPIIFHGVLGKDMREGNSPSFYNAAEVSEVKHYVEKLRDTPGQRVPLSEIAIVTPYRKQVEKIRSVLNSSGISEVKVGSVEEFQGQESRVLIISTVRSSDKFLSYDYKHQLGFLSNPKRFNVAITRAKQLLILIGNPYVLINDNYWGAFLKYCLENNAYRGVPPPPVTREPFERSGLFTMLAGLKIDEDYSFDMESIKGYDFSAPPSIAADPEWAEPSY